MSAATEMNGLVIGVDVDQRYDSTTVVTSATKGLGPSVKQVLEAIYKEDKWTTYGGKTTYINAASNGVGLPTVVIGDDNADAFDRFTSFSKADYDAIFAQLVNNSITPIRTLTIASDSGYATSEELNSGLSLTKVVAEARQ